MNGRRLLLVEDDNGLAEPITWHFEKAGYRIDKVGDGEEALLLVAEAPPDLLLIDWMVPGISGIELCRRIRCSPASARLPIIMIAGRTDASDRVRALETGADDFVTKPCSPRELLARVSALLRRTRPETALEKLGIADLQMDLASHKVKRAGRTVHLGPTEFRLLRHFLENPGRVLSRERLLGAVWGRDTEVETRTVDGYIRRIRSAINATGGAQLIRTVRSAGYAMDDDQG